VASPNPNIYSFFRSVIEIFYLYFCSNSQFGLFVALFIIVVIVFLSYRSRALDIFFHDFFLRILTSQNLFVWWEVIRICWSVKFFRVPMASRDEKAIIKLIKAIIF